LAKLQYAVANKEQEKGKNDTIENHDSHEYHCFTIKTTILRNGKRKKQLATNAV
jgi:hypothetical protein